MTYEDVFLDSEDDPLQAIRDGMDDHRRRRAELVTRISDKYLRIGRDKQLSDELAQLVDGTIASIDGGHPEGRMLVVTGDPGAGKTWAIERALASIPGLSEKSLVSFVAPRPCTLKQLGRSFLNALGYPLQRDLLEHLTWEKVRHQLPLMRKQFVWIDEMHHAMGKNEDELAKLCDTLKNVMQQRTWPVSFILSGLPLVSTFVGRDRQVERRSRTVRFERLTFPENAKLMGKTVAAVIETHAGMTLNGLITDEFLHRLCRATEGGFGSTIHMTRMAILRAFDRENFDGSVTINDFAKAYAAERGCDSSQNIFLAEKWYEIEPSNSRLADEPEPPAEEAPVKRRKRRK